MPRHRAAAYLILALSTSLVLTGCGDDPPTGPDAPFSVTVEVTLPDGGPAAGVRVAGMPRLDHMMPPILPADGGGGPWHQVNVGVDMLADGLAAVTIRDITGADVRTLVSEPLPAGLYMFPWDGRDDAGATQPGGWYSAHVVLDWTDGTGQVHDLPLILEACDPDWHTYGETGADGVLVIDDPRLVPALRDPAPVGETELTGRTLLRLENAHGDGQYLTIEATDGANQVVVTWQPDYESFRFEVQVLDADGQPVSGAAIGAMPALPDHVWPDGPDHQVARSAVGIRIELEAPLAVRIDIQDIAGSAVRIMDFGPLVAGVHQFVWNGRDDLDRQTPPGWYEVVLRTSADGGAPSWTAVDSTSMLQAVVDPDQYAVATTDAAGRAVITDRRLVPAFWNPPPLTHRDEIGEDLGAFELTTETWLLVVTAGAGRLSTWASVEAVDGAQSVPIILGAPAPGAGTVARPIHQERGRDVDTPPLTTRLIGAYPNPFN